MPDSLYSVKAVCQLTGLKAATLHVWERRYGAVLPRRFSNNQRFYTSQDVDKLSLLVAAKDMGHRIGSVAHLSIDDLRAMIPSSPTSDALPIPYKRSKSSSSQAICDRTLQALRRNHFDRVHHELETARLRLGIVGFVLDFMVPLLHRVRQMIEDKTLSILREQILTNIIKSNIHIASVELRTQRSSVQRPLGKRVALATMNGHYCELEIMLASLLCTVAGMVAHYLGTRLSMDDLTEAVHELRIDRLIITLPKSHGSAIVPENIFQHLLLRIPKSCEVWIRGDLWNFRPMDYDARQMFHITSLRDLYHTLRLR